MKLQLQKIKSFDSPDVYTGLYDLLIAGLSVAYKMSDFPAHGPFPNNFEIIQNSDGTTSVKIR